MKRGIFVVISGPSGVGKNTLVDILVNDKYGIYSVSYTTRKKRKNEVDGEDYFYITNEEFENKIRENKFLEYAKYSNNYYGTSKEFVFDNINKGINVIAIIDVQGTIKIKEVLPDAILVFIMPPSFEELRQRLIKRNTDSPKEIEKRLEIAKKEIKYKDKYDYIVINNTVNEAVIDIKKIINEECKK